MKFLKLFEDYKYLPKQIEEELYHEYKDAIIDSILGLNLNYDDIQEIINCNSNYNCYLEDFKLSHILNKIRKKLRKKSYSSPEISNSFYDLVNRIYKENNVKIDLSMDEKIINYFRKHKEDYFDFLNDNDHLEQIFPDRITQQLNFILTTKRFNL